MSEVKRFDAFTSFDDFKSRMVESKDGNYVAYSDYLSQLQQTDTLQTSLNNIINAFGISDEGAHSNLVIEYVHGLVADKSRIAAEASMLKEVNADVMRSVYRAKTHMDSGKSVDAERALQCAIGRKSGSTEDTDAAIAEIKAQGVGEFAADMWKRGNELVAEGGQQRLVVQVRLAAKLADTYVDNLRAGRKG